jgi:hypothetical protein
MARLYCHRVDEGREEEDNDTMMEDNNAEILWDTYSKKSPLPRIGNFPHLVNSPKLSSYQLLGQSRVQQRHTTCYNHP